MLSDYVKRCEHCGEPKVDISALMDRACEWPAAVDCMTPFAMIMTHATLHTISAHLRSWINGDGQLLAWPEPAPLMQLTSMASAAACWLILGSWAEDPFDLSETPHIGPHEVSVISSRALVHMNLHELAKPPAGD